MKNVSRTKISLSSFFHQSAVPQPLHSNNLACPTGMESASRTLTDKCLKCFIIITTCDCFSRAHSFPLRSGSTFICLPSFHKNRIASFMTRLSNASEYMLGLITGSNQSPSWPLTDCRMVAPTVPLEAGFKIIGVIV